MIVTYNKSTARQAAEIVARGGVIAFRTDTFYGLGANPFDVAALRRIKKLKGREESKPILVLISGSDQIERLIAERSKAFKLLTEKFWPGPLTLIGKARPEVPHEVTAGTGTVGLRLPDDEDARALVHACGGALTATSANPSGQQPAKSAQEVAAYFPSGVDLIIDGGASRGEKASTVMDVSGIEPRLIREGAISKEELMAAREFAEQTGQ